MYFLFNFHGIQKTIQSFSFTQLGQCKANPRSLLLTWDAGQKTLDVQTPDGARIMGLMRDYLAVLRATAKYARALKDYFGMIYLYQLKL